MKGQTDLFDEIIVDNFAGGGGASTGIELATGRPMAESVVRANLPEWCRQKITTMQQLDNLLSV